MKKILGVLLLTGLAVTTFCVAITIGHLPSLQETATAFSPAAVSRLTAGAAVDGLRETNSGQTSTILASSIENWPACVIQVGDRCNCSDFVYQEDAQAALEAVTGDPHKLDENQDGKACEGLPNRPTPRVSLERSSSVSSGSANNVPVTQTPNGFSTAGISQTAARRVLFEETFSGTTVFGWTIDISPRARFACLTARGTNPRGSIPICGIPTNRPGQGALRLTDSTGNVVTNGNYQATYAFYNQAIPARYGLVITFDYFSYGGQPFNGSAGDGITFLLFDGTTPSNLFTVGAFGGSLGYAQGTTIGTIAPGLTNAYIGVGFDEFGSFANDTEGRGANSSFPNNCATTAGFPVAASGRVPDSVTVRGSGGRRRNRQDGYCVLANSGSLVAQVNDPNGIDNPSVPAIGPRNQARRSVRITLTPNSVLTVEMSLSGTGNFQRVIGPLNLRQFPNQVPPTTFKFGFASSTGLATNIHEVQNLRITTLENVGGNVPRCNRGPNRCQP